ncbi:MAG: 16S rRNA (cytidine(1402)-2'-O)-methyltransferase [Nitrospirota bacterium]|nr:16S rRNA (cytidine(1402)-2'-O)-methyltransferase [Nitrospirota bacterium]
MRDTRGILYVVATPIGHLEDITLRALAVLKAVDVVAAEDTRHTQKLLTHHGIHAQLTSYHDHNKDMKAPVLIERLLAGKNVALVTDAGTPLISDPGFFLVGEAHRAGITVTPVPGPSAPVAALSVAGLATDCYTFLGYLAPRSGARRNRLEAFREHPCTLVLFEAPHRILKTLEDIAAVLGERQVAVLREMTKQHEEIVRGTAAEIAARLGERSKILGEFTVVIEGWTRHHRQAARREEKMVRAAARKGGPKGEKKKLAAKKLAGTGRAEKGRAEDPE